MLPRPLRVVRPAEHRELGRLGARAGTRTLVVHVSPPPAGRSLPGSGPPARAGVVVGRPVGGAVTRHRVARRLRHLLAERLPRLAPGTALVVRARPPAASAPSTVLGDDLDAALSRASAAQASRLSRPSRPSRGRARGKDGTRVPEPAAARP